MNTLPIYLLNLINNYNNNITIIHLYQTSKYYKDLLENNKNKIIKIKNYIFILYSKKNSMIKKKNQISKRAIWKKNFNRVLAGRNLNRLQKSSFIGQYN